MQVNIPDEFLPFIQKNIDMGSFRSPDDLVTEALRSFRDMDELSFHDKAALDAALDKSMRDLDAGLGISFDELKKKLNIS